MACSRPPSRSAGVAAPIRSIYFSGRTLRSSVVDRAPMQARDMPPSTALAYAEELRQVLFLVSLLGEEV